LTVNGQPAANGYTAFTNYSDARLKDNTAVMGDGYLSKIMQLKPSSFNYNTLSGYDEATRSRTIYGFIAQELQAVFPEMVGRTEVNGTDYLDTNLSSLPIYMIKAMQEQQNEITTQSSVLSALALKTDQNITTLAGLQTSVDSQLLIASNKLDTLTASDASQSNLLTHLQQDFTTQTATITETKSTVTDMQTELATLMDFYSTFQLGQVIAKDNLGNVDLLAGSLRAAHLVTEGLTIETTTATAPTIGSAILYPAPIDANQDGKDDFTGEDMPTDANQDGIDDISGQAIRDGKSVTIPTVAVSEKSRIFVTPKTTVDESLAVTGENAGVNFVVSVKHTTPSSINFNWFIITEQ
jgi:hypothetical protein